jgi:hypothetical protein
MPKISTYTVVAPKAKDKIIISESGGTPSNVTKNVTVGGLKTFINDGAAGTLQEVTTSGNTTDKTITTQGIKSEGTRDTDLVVKVGDYDASFNKTRLEVDVAAETISVNANILKLNKLGGTNTDITFNPTASRSIAIPDASGTFALTSDLPSASLWNTESGSGINYQAGNVGIGTVSGGDALTVNGQISSTAIETGGILVEGNATIDDNLSAGAVSASSVTANTLTGNLVGTVATTTTGTTQPSTTDNNLLATTAFVQDLLGDIVSGLQFQELWDANTDTPNLSTATPSNGDFWIVKVAGTTNLSGITTWAVGDWAIYIVPAGGGASFWQKVDNTTSLSGTGTGGKIAKWSGVGGSDVLTDSIITETGTTVVVSGNVEADTLDIQSTALFQGNISLDESANITENLTVQGDIFLTSDLSNKISTSGSGLVNILGDTAVSLESSDGLDFSVSDVFEFIGSTGINIFNGNALSANLDVSQITTSRSFQFPDNSGTVALLSDIPATTGPSEWVGQISQNSTSAPTIARTQTSTLFVGDRVTTPTAFRDITFSRNAVGTYRLVVNWTQSTVPTDANKLSIMFGDNVARVYSFTLGSINGVNYKEFLFRTYTPAGVEADDQLLGINGAMTSVILYS